MNITEIGIVQLWYNENGKAVRAMFEPTIANYGKDCADQLVEATTGNNTEKIKQDAEMIISHWFARMIDIELADRDQHKISSSLKQVVKWANGNVQYCRMLFWIEKIN